MIMESNSSFQERTPPTIFTERGEGGETDRGRDREAGRVQKGIFTPS